MKMHANNKKIEYAIQNGKTLTISPYTNLPRARD